MADAQSVEENRSNLAISGELSRAALYNNAMDVYKNVVANAIACKSTARPQNPVLGQEIYETDTGKSLKWTGAGGWVDHVAFTAAGGSLSGTYPNPSLASGSVGISQLATSARTWVSYFWLGAWPAGNYQQLTAGFSVPTQSTCMFIMDVTAYTSSAYSAAVYGAVDGVTGWFEWTRYFHNTTYDHRTYPAGFQTINLAAGSYTLRHYMASGQLTDSNDRSTGAVIGVPY